MEERISWFPIAGRATLSPETVALFDQLEAKLGFVPNVFRAFAWKEERFKRWLAHFDHLMQPSPGLGKAEREMISVVVSMQNQCLYCLTAHGFAVRALLKDPVKGERVTLDYRRAGLSEKQMAMLDFAVKLTLDPVTVSEDDIDDLRAAGFEDEDIWDIAEVTAMFNFTNRVMSATGVLPNPEYHGMAR
ncbi:MAG: peroxidase-related enzyme [Dehalococcoidia bacterium]|nr:MAG: alkylhydroperoxidase [bacterium]MCK6563268.1 peroxidase-related enzyme [Dehalococcoidia bacterium]MCL4232776.1 peroxidase-related enzyme [Dehalococcoidia bacterium]NUQ56829.1 peroxidase-related enzyme [Dehalococcoidia bacterium]RIL02533.1 MAG: alkylhydroperoxidase [bacterium]